MPISFTINATKEERINVLLTRLGFSSSNIFNLIKEEHVLVNNIVIHGRNYIVHICDLVSVTLNDENNELLENNTPIDIVYEDEYILVVNKTYNLDVEPSLHTRTNNLASMVTYYFIRNNIKSKIHLVNRLDKLTTGLVIIAKNRYIKNKFAKVNILKKYLCLVDGKTDEYGYITNRIMKGDNDKRIVVNEGGKICKTEYRLIDYKDNKSLLEITLHTGRTHQIRVTMENIGHPLCGDVLYNKNPVGDMYLKAYYLKFIHPITGDEIELKI